MIKLLRKRAGGRWLMTKFQPFYYEPVNHKKTSFNLIRLHLKKCNFGEGVNRTRFEGRDYREKMFT